MEQMSDKEIIEALIARNARVTQRFFYEDCRPLFASIIRNVFSYEVDYDEFVNELYLYLMEDDAYKLRQFEGRSSVYQWLKVVALRYFVKKRDLMIDDAPNSSPLKEDDASENSESMLAAKIDMRHLLDCMPNRRQAYVIEQLVMEDRDPAKVADELNVTVDNLYNIKKRAIAAITAMAIKDAEVYGKGRRKK